jgi:hypothetical protein
MVFATRLSGGKGGRNGLEAELRRPGVQQKNGKPNHPQTQGKVERLWQTLKKWLAAQPRQPATLAELQAQLDTSLPATTASARTARCRTARPPPPGPRPPQATGPPTPTTASAPTIGPTGTVTLRTGGKLYHLGVGRAHAGTHIIMLVQDLRIRISHAATGKLLRDLTLDPSRNYQPTGRSPGPTPTTPANASTPNPDVGSGVLDVPRHHTVPR